MLSEDSLVFGGLTAAAVLVTVRALTLWRTSRFGLRDAMGPANWDFSTSWASTLTVVGALLGTILGSTGVLPATTKYLPHATYSALNLLFGMVVVLAPFSYRVFAKPTSVTTSPGVRQTQYEGTIGGFLVAIFLTTWGVLGEVATTLLLFSELQISEGATVLFLVVLGLTDVLLVVYAWRSIGWVMTDQAARRTDKSAREQVLKARIVKLGGTADDSVVAPLPSWSLL